MTLTNQQLSPAIAFNRFRTDPYRASAWLTTPYQLSLQADEPPLSTLYSFSLFADTKSFFARFAQTI
jgi:hypothetical protein